MIGASGAISGVLGAYFVLHPSVRIKTLLFLGIYFRTFQIPANILLGIWIALQVIAGLMAEPGEPGVAWFAHIGGFAAGLALVHVFRDPDIPLWGRRRNGGPWG
jgi:membrane associated rhomboid family serine protease